MKILFLTIGYVNSINDCNIYTDLLRSFKHNGHEIYAVCPYEKRMGKPTELINEDGAKMLHVCIGNITKCGTIEKGISTLQIESKFLSAIKKYFSGVKFDLIMYTTPPITFEKVIRYIKKRDNAKTYLLLKDIFPQNAIDIGLMSKSGVKGLLYKYFRKKEKRLYAVSDHIGCMSQGNVDYVLNNNPEVLPDKVCVCPNSVSVRDLRIDDEDKELLRKAYGIPLDKTVFVYGGNLGKPQGIPFIIDCLKKLENNKDAFFLIVGDGTEYGKLEKYFNEAKPTNMKLMDSLPKEEYDRMISSCDVGMIFLDHRFTIPNIPSRLLAYMQAGLPVLASTDSNTDLGEIITEGEFGWWCESNNPDNFARSVEKILSIETLTNYADNSFEYLKKNYSVDNAYRIIMKNIK